MLDFESTFSLLPASARLFLCWVGLRGLFPAHPSFLSRPPQLLLAERTRRSLRPRRASAPLAPGPLLGAQLHPVGVVIDRLGDGRGADAGAKVSARVRVFSSVFSSRARPASRSAAITCLTEMGNLAAPRRRRRRHARGFRGEGEMREVLGEGEMVGGRVRSRDFRGRVRCVGWRAPEG